MEDEKWDELDSIDREIERRAANNREKFGLIWRTTKRLVRLAVVLSVAMLVQMCSMAMLTTEETVLKTVLEIINEVMQSVKQQ